MAITAAGVGSGLDIENIVSQLMSLERRPLVALQRKTASAESEISALGSFKSQLSTFQDAMQELSSLDAFRKFSTSSTDKDVLTGVADGDAAAGSFSVEITRLAQNSRYGSKEFAEGETIGGGAGDGLTLTVDGESVTIDLSAPLTVSGLREAINSADDNPGVTATVLNVGGGRQRLLLTAEESGYEKRVEIGYTGSLNGASFDFAVTNKDDQGATLVDLTQLDAAYSIDGFALTASSNNVSDAVDGLTLQLKDIGSAVLSLSRDDAAIAESAENFVNAYNQLRADLNALENEGFSTSGLTRSVNSGLRGVLNATTSLDGTFTALSQVGIRTNATTGDLEFNSTEFNAALDEDFTAVAKLFANDDQGVAFRFDALIDRFLDSDGGLIDTRIDTLNDRKRSLELREDSMEARLELKERSLRAEYAELDRLVSSLQSTGNFLFQNLGV